MNITVPVEIPNRMIRDVLETANEHSGYWAQVTSQSHQIPRFELLEKILDGDGWIEYGEVDESKPFGPLEVGEERYRLDLESVRKGMKLVAEKYPRHFADIMNDNHDATTGDVLLQCCLLGEIVYG